MTTHLYLLNNRTLECNGKHYACAIGKAGMAGAGEKREGDNKTPWGIYPLREVFYRADKWVGAPVTGLPTRAIAPNMGWCDDAAHPHYNQLVNLPFDASHEKMWREDELYNLVIVIGYNDEPATPGKGSAIFAHIAKPDYAGTEGCVALKIEDWLEILPELTVDSCIYLEPSS